MRGVRLRVSRRTAAALFTALLAFAAGAAIVARPYAHGLSFVIRAAGLHGTAARLASLDTRAVSTAIISIPGAARGRESLRARVYTPAGTSRRAALLVSGLHPSGIEEPRLVALANQLAASGFTVVTPDIRELSQFEITPAIPDAIEQAALWLSNDRQLAADGRVGLMGISFSGGLSIVAAGRPSLANRVAFVFALGGHDDLPRVLRYLCTGLEPGAPYRAPHDYGVAVILLGTAERLVPPAQVRPLEDAVHRFLLASALDGVDQAAAAREFADLRAVASAMPEPSATLMKYVNDRDVAHLGPRLLPVVGFYGDAPSLSAARSPHPTAPVFLLHGTDDNVVPADESRFLEQDLRATTPVRLLVSTLITHAEVDRPPHVGEVLKLAGFWGDLLQR
jgi:dienelactone hydrolase